MYKICRVAKNLNFRKANQHISSGFIDGGGVILPSRRHLPCLHTFLVVMTWGMVPAAELPTMHRVALQANFPGPNVDNVKLKKLCCTGRTIILSFSLGNAKEC